MDTDDLQIEPSPANAAEVFAASRAQQRLWVLYELDRSSIAYSLPGAILLEGSLDQAAFRAALQDLVSRHESLRTTFCVVRDQPAQWIHPQAEVALKELDLSSAPDPDAAARECVEANARQPFDLRRGPLFRALLLRLGPCRHIFAYNLHHIITDEASQRILVREFNTLYAARVAGSPHSLPPLDFQYKDFAAWQNEHLNSPEAESHRRYWLNRFSGDLPVLELATDFPRPPVKTFAGQTLSVVWDQALLRQIEQAAMEAQATPFLFLLALVRIELFRSTGQSDLVIGTPVVNREEPGLEDQIGFYANTLALRQSLSPCDSFRQLLQREKETFLEAFDHQLYPFDQLVSDLRVRRDLSRAPLFEVSMQFQNFAAAELQLGNLRISDFGVETTPAKLDLSYDFVRGDSGIRCGLTFNTDLFHPDRVRDMLDHLRQLAAEVLLKPDTRIDRLTMLTDQERCQIIEHFNRRPGGQSPQTITELFDAVSVKDPAAVAVRCGQESLTFLELQRKSDQLAAYLAERGVGLESRVGVCLERSLDWVVAVIGIMKAGAIYLPLDPAHPVPRLQQLLDDARPTLVLAAPHIESPLLSSLGARGLIDVRWPLEIASMPTQRAMLPPQWQNGAYLIYTSGSTGKPKGVLVEHGGFANMIRDQIDAFAISADDRGLQFSSVSYDASLYELFLSLLAGATAVIIPRRTAIDGRNFRQFLQDQRVTVATLPPSFTRAVGLESLQSLRLLISAGEPAAVDLCSQLGQSQMCINAYGPTEASVCASYHRVRPEGDYRLGIPIGRPVSGDQLYILDAALNLVPRGVVGELYVGGAGVARGYLHRPELTAAAFIPDPFGRDPGSRLYRTGDLTRWTRDGEVQFAGRRDFQVKVRGYRIELGEIEAALSRLPAVREAVVAVHAGPDGNQRLTAYIVPVQGPISVAALRGRLSQELPESLLPDRFVELTAIPTNAAGKVDRQALPHPDTFAAELEVESEPRTSLERVLALIYARVIGRKAISIRDSFFELGGNSLMATQAASRIRDLLRVELSVTALFESPSVEQLAARLQSEQSGSGQLEKIAAAIVRYENLTPAEKAALVDKARQRTPTASAA